MVTVNIDTLLDDVVPVLASSKNNFKTAIEIISAIKLPGDFPYSGTLKATIPTIETCIDETTNVQSLILEIASRWASAERLNGEVTDQIDLWELFLALDKGTDQIGRILGNMSEEELAELLDNLQNTETSESNPLDDIPLYNQLVYSNTQYGGSTLQESGCGPTCAAMEFSFLLNDPTLTPDKLLELYPNLHNFNASGDGSGDIFEYLVTTEGPIKDRGITLEHCYWQEAWGGVDDINDSKIMTALENGQQIIALVSSNSIFTNTGHFILLTGINENGNIVVRDPNGENYSPRNSTLSNGLGKPKANTDDGTFDPTKPFELEEEGERIFSKIF